MKKIAIFLVLMLVWLFSSIGKPVFAETTGEIGLTSSEEDLSIYTKIESKEELEGKKFKLGIEIDKAKSNDKDVRDYFKIWSSTSQEIKNLIIGISLDLSVDKIRDYQRTSIVGNLGKNFNFRDIDFKPEIGLGYSFTSNLSNSPILVLKDTCKYEMLYQEAKLLFPTKKIEELEIENEVGFEKKLTEILSLKTSYTLKYFRAFSDRYEHIGRIKLSFSI